MEVSCLSLYRIVLSCQNKSQIFFDEIFPDFKKEQDIAKFSSSLFERKLGIWAWEQCSIKFGAENKQRKLRLAVRANLVSIILEQFKLVRTELILIKFLLVFVSISVQF